MATLYSTITTHKLSPHAKPITESKKTNFSPTVFSTQLFTNKSKSNPPNNLSFSTQKRRNLVIGSVTEDREVVPVKNKLAEDQESRLLLNGSDEFQPLSPSEGREEEQGDDDLDRLVSKAINATIVLGFGTFAVTKLLTIDLDYWHVSGLVLIALLIFSCFVRDGFCQTWLFYCSLHLYRFLSLVGKTAFNCQFCVSFM